MKFYIDDFGSSTASNINILSLLHNTDYFQGVSCIVSSEDVDDMAEDFKKLSQSDVRIGLHLTFTDFTFLSTKQKMPRNSQFFSLHIRPQARFILWEIKAQVEKFKLLMGRYPDFIDGHHHIHQSPLYARALVRYLEENPQVAARLEFVRVSKIPLSILSQLLGYSKKLFLKNFGLACYGAFASVYFKKNKITQNDILLGGYPLEDQDLAFAQVIEFLQKTQWPIDQNVVLFCHPGAKEFDPSLQKEITFKYQEYLYFKERQIHE